jgi:PqqD family protein of HPr-rel-A system
MIFKYWGNQCVTYHIASGDTHLLSRPNATLLELLRASTSEQKMIDHIIHASLTDNKQDALALLETASTTFKQLKLLNS